MTKRRFSSRQLYILRNKIPVKMLIERDLNIPSKIVEGYFRFLCPLCNEFNTAVNNETNLARCFNCEKNYNTIDLVLLIRKSDFVQSIQFLEKIYKSMSASQRHILLQPNSNIASQVSCRNESTTQIEKSDNMPQHVGEILGNVLSKDIVEHSEKQLVNNSHKEKISAQDNMANGRIVKLEQKVDLLVHQIDKIIKTITANNPTP